MQAPTVPRTSLLVVASLVVAVIALAVPAQCALDPVHAIVVPGGRRLLHSAPDTTSHSYDPTKVNWDAVATACWAAGKQEKRLYSFFTRAAFHDAGAVPAVKCSSCPFGAGTNTHIVRLGLPSLYCLVSQLPLSAVDTACC
jgi:hypothetical protein